MTEVKIDIDEKIKVILEKLNGVTIKDALIILKAIELHIQDTSIVQVGS